MASRACRGRSRHFPLSQLRSLTLPGADSTPTLASLTSRLQNNGITGSTGSMSVREIRDEVVPVEEKERCVFRFVLASERSCSS